MSSRAESSKAEQHGSSFFGRIQGDLLPSLVVFLVALPLCLGIALASGAPMAAGLITGIVGGIVVGSLAGAPLQVSGPAAGLTVLVYELISRHGLVALGPVVMFCGLFQIIAGCLQLGSWFRAVSPAVIQGMLSGIGVLILSSQFHVMVDDAPRSNGLANLVSIPEAVWKGLPWPQLGSREAREQRVALLQEASMLHERQEELRERTFELVAVKAADFELQDQASFKPLEESQAALSADLNAFAAKVRGQNAADTSAELSKLEPALAAALSGNQTALNDLQQHRMKNMRESQATAEAGLRGVRDGLKNHDWAAKIGLATILVIVLWLGFAPKKLKIVPAQLVSVALATAVCVGLSLPVNSVELPQDLLSGVHMPWTYSQDVLGELPWGALLTAGLLLAAVASAETLLCAVAVDQMHTGPRTKFNRELAAQGFGNFICGMMGALPMTGVIVRSAANVQAGGKSRASSIFHGLWLLVMVVFMAGVLRMIPTCSLAAVLVFTGYKLLDLKSAKKLWNFNKAEFCIFFATAATIVVVDLLSGVLLGVALAAARLLLHLSCLKIAREDSTEDPQAITLTLRGAATFMALPRLAAAVESLPSGSRVTVRSDGLEYIDHACLELLSNWQRQYRLTGGSVEMDWDQLKDNYRPRRHELEQPVVSSEGALAHSTAD